ncbi:MAG: glycosyltransferase [Smithella sp.]|jgi:glycosyltransferase involved in cell wall biosynthesis
MSTANVNNNFKEYIVLCNSKVQIGGGEFSAQWLASRLNAPLVSLSTDAWKEVRGGKQLWYINDFCYRYDKDMPAFKNVINSAEKVFLVINFAMGNIRNEAWMKDKVKKIFFLNNAKLNEFQDKCCPELKDVPKVALPPPVDLSPFLAIKRDYNRQPVKIGRHSKISLKFHSKSLDMYKELMKRLPNALWHFQTAPNTLINEFRGNDKVKILKLNETPVPAFLEGIDIHLAIISEKCCDQGNRVTVEAMASGLPVICDNKGGMVDRVDDGKTGFLVNSIEEAIQRTEKLYYFCQLRQEMGQMAREKAKIAFNPMRWIKELEE